MKTEDKKWVTLELTRRAEKEKPEDLKTLLKGEASIPDDLELFIPATSFDRRDNFVTVCLMEGYVFLEGGRPSSFYFHLENCSYVSRVLSRDESTGRYLAYVPDEKIQDLKDRLRKQTLRDFGEGDEVEIIGGAYDNLEGEVVEFNKDDDHAFVKIDGLVSIDTIVELPLQFLRKTREYDDGNESNH